jgi:hypothetical protein
LALTGHQTIAKQHLGDGIGGQASTLHSGSNGGAAQVVRSKRGKITLKTAHGGPGGTDDHDGI